MLLGIVFEYIIGVVVVGSFVVVVGFGVVVDDVFVLTVVVVVVVNFLLVLTGPTQPFIQICRKVAFFTLMTPPPFGMQMVQGSLDGVGPMRDLACTTK